MTRVFRQALAAAALASLTFAVAAQTTWPTKPVRLVVAYAPGGTTDYAARQIAQKLTEQTGQSFFVENKAGGRPGTSEIVLTDSSSGTVLAATLPVGGAPLYSHMEGQPT